jgi:hypothetical protein
MYIAIFHRRSADNPLGFGVLIQRTCCHDLAGSTALPYHPAKTRLLALLLPPLSLFSLLVAYMPLPFFAQVSG